jgi:hypothetical protein
MLGRNGGTDTGHVATGGIIEIRIAEASRSERTKVTVAVGSFSDDHNRRQGGVIVLFDNHPVFIVV